MVKRHRHAVPWRIVPEVGPSLIVSTVEPGYIAKCFNHEGNGLENAKAIVCAVNAYPDLMEFTRDLEVVLQQEPDKVTADWLKDKLNSLFATLAYDRVEG